MNKLTILLVALFAVSINCNFINFQFVKPGRCPKPIGLGTCDKKCLSDFSCPGRQKCCSNGCGHTCEFPVSKVRNECPDTSGITTCEITPDYCYSDAACESGYKCCPYGCNNRCLNVTAPIRIPRSPGSCPDTSGIITTCEIKRDSCSSDVACGAGYKCCPYGCGLRCLNVET